MTSTRVRRQLFGLSLALVYTHIPRYDLYERSNSIVISEWQSVELLEYILTGDKRHMDTVLAMATVMETRRVHGITLRCAVGIGRCPLPT